MCGIAGILKLTGSILTEDVGAVLQMLDAQFHRDHVTGHCSPEGPTPPA